MQDRADFSLYYYTPNLAAAIVMVIAFSIISAALFAQLAYYRHWWMIVLFVGALAELAGYALSLVPVFVTIDVVSLLVQGAGGGIAGSSDTIKVPVAGVAVQLFGYLLFNAVFLSFWQRVRKDPPPLYYRMRPFFIAVLISSVSIILRSIFRVVEMAVGWQGVINHTEWTLYVFDGALCWIAIVILILYSPMKYLPKYFSWRFNPDQDGPPEPNWAKPRPEIRAATNKEAPESALDSPVSSNDNKGRFSSAPENHTLINVDQSATLTAPNLNISKASGSDAHLLNQANPTYAAQQRVPGTSATVMGGGQNDTYEPTTMQPTEQNHIDSESFNYLKNLRGA